MLPFFSDESFLFLICRKKPSENRVLAALGVDCFTNKIYYHSEIKQQIIKIIFFAGAGGGICPYPSSRRIRLSRPFVFLIDTESNPPMSTIPLSKLSKGAVAHIDSIVANPIFGELDPLVTRRLADLGFSSGMPLQVIAVGGFGRGPFAVRLGNQSQFSLRQEEAGKIICHVIDG